MTLTITFEYDDVVHVISEKFSEEDYSFLSHPKHLELVVMGLLFKNSWTPGSIHYRYGLRHE